MNRRSVQCSLLMLVAAQVGCAQRLPTYPWVDETHAMQLIAERSARSQTLSSPCRLILADPNTGPTQLDGAIAARMPGLFRLRAWKFSQPVLDITLTPAGLWLYSAQNDEFPGNRPLPFANLNAEQLRRAWSLVMGEIPRDGWTWDQTSSHANVRIREDWESGGSIVCTIDRPTLTLRACTVTQSADVAVLTLTLDRYQAIEHVAVPTRVIMHFQRSTITILLDDVSFNEELPPTAFDPPRRAVRQP